MRVEVYWNLHRPGQYSVRKPGGRVLFYTDRIHLRDCTPVVQRAGHAKVLRTGRKNVHAFLRGELVWTQVLEVRAGASACWTQSAELPPCDSALRLRYRPQDGPWFVDELGNKPGKGESWALVKDKKPLVLHKETK